MKEKDCNLIIGALLHDFGKLLYRYNDGRNHSTSGYEFLKNEVKLQEDILNQVQYHHFNHIQNAKISSNSLAYITYIADNIASFIDRRKSNEDAHGFSRDLPQESIFNLLNGTGKKHFYSPTMLDENINYPLNNDAKIKFDEFFYGDVVRKITDNLKSVEYNSNYINSLLEILQATLSYIPSSTSKDEIADISLFDHSKMTAAIALCIQKYLQENKTKTYRETLFLNSKMFYDKKAFMVYSLDISGIQDFIYNVSSDGALKALVTRSFYLELIMETVIDNLLTDLELSRTNILYLGGGHAYLLLPNTEDVKETIKSNEAENNQWFLNNFKTALYITGGFAECSANDLKNEPQGSYNNIFKDISNDISKRKTNRYNASDIMFLNNQQFSQHERECSSCLKTEELTETGRCSLCENLVAFANEIRKGQFYTVLSEKQKNKKPWLPLPKNLWLTSLSEKELVKIINNDEHVRSYSKNEMYTGKNISTTLWVGEYAYAKEFKDFVQDSSGIERIAVLRADIDNLGKAFVQGFENETDKDFYVTISRTATFSRKLSLFFKRHINAILAKGEYFLTDFSDNERKATIVYSGGDDLFVVGNWEDIIGFAVDLNESLERYSQGKLTLSAGIGIYPIKHPVLSMARESGQLEELAKNTPSKNAVAIFDENHVYTWEDFINGVLEEKYNVIKDFFEKNENYGKNYLYNLMDLLRNTDEKINLARYVYTLSRMAPKENATQSEKDMYEEFSKNMYSWIKDEKSRKQAITAIYIYVYTIREKGD